MDNRKRQEAKHPIQVAARRSGLTPDVIRVWERRYQAITPTRSGTNRRFYNDEDIERLLLLAQVTGAGRRIGEVADLDMEQLREMVWEDRSAEARLPRTPARVDSGSLPARHLSDCIKAVSALDAEALESNLNRARAALAPTVLMEQVMMPLMHLIGERWYTGTMRAAEEHMTTPILRATLWSLKNSHKAGENAPELLVATPAGQHHELGALMAAVVAASDGWRVTYLGSDMPATEIAAAAVTREVRAIALSLTYPSDDPAIGGELSILTGTVPAVVLVGGVAAAAYRDGIRRAGALEVPTTAVLRGELRKLRADPGRTAGAVHV